MRLITAIFLLCSSAHALANEWWAWGALEYWRDDQNKAWLFLGNRLDEADGAYVQIVSPRFRHEIAPWLDVGVGLSWLEIESLQSGDRYSQFRPELELNPIFDLTPHLALEWRNRMEWRWNEGAAFTTHRLRHRLQLAWTLPEPVGPLTRLFVSNEWLVDVHRREWAENRLVPVGGTLKVSDSTDLDIFHMVLSSRVNSDWRHESVLGTYLRVMF